ncbi:glycosyltransferase family 4 protein [Acaryochloris sp. CCMEE 5410]|uniref:glycosyltransferase family 4 protein n=1 Tax=Acaryochloris sp. CCMEE 5410 TaxID=310037 RepID=UPI00024838C9|nr:glycosyltransferase family 4 protein [Acaryochloris sp. CCMEE 5410]KAI9132434.1 glycosyltransferase family 4 protein [Acaryochloris sp. CCMEE 5410]
MHFPTSIENESKQCQVANGAIGERSDLKMTIYFAPQYLSINPYQKQLASSLEDLGARVEGVNGMTVFLPKAIKSKNLNVVHLHWLHQYYRAPEFKKFPIFKVLRFPFAVLTLIKFLSGLIFLKAVGIKIVWTAHNLKSHEALFPLLDYVCRLIVVYLSDAVIAHGPAAKAAIARRYQLKKLEKIRIVPHGNYIQSYDNSVAQPEARQVLGIENTSLVFLFLGLVRPYKGVGELIEVFNQIEHPDKTLIIAGKTLNDSFSQEIKAKAETQTNIKFIPGFVPDEEIQTYMNASDAVVFPYRDVLTSGAMILAMSFGKPCIAPSIGCVQEILDPAGAFLYDPGQTNGLLKAMEQTTCKKNDLRSMGAHNRCLAKHWDWTAIAQQTLEIYLQISGA